MAETAVQKLMARAAGVPEAPAPGSFVRLPCDLVLVNELSANRAIDIFEEIGAQGLFEPSRIVMVPDHFTPAKDIRAAELCAKVRSFARKHGARYFEVGRGGVEHILLPEQGLVRPGDIVIGGDSHTCTYGALGAFATGVGATDIAVAWALGDAWFKVPETVFVELSGRLAGHCGGKDVILRLLGELGVDGARYMTMEYGGPGVRDLAMHDRFTIANMAIEAGAKNAFFPVDDRTIEFLREAGAAGSLDPSVVGQWLNLAGSDEGASFAARLQVNLDEIEPLVACPDLPSNVRPASELSSVEVDQVVLGCCTNGWLEDLRTAAALIGERKVHDRVRMIVVPGTRRIYEKAAEEGILAGLAAAGAVIAPPGCGPCLGGHLGVLASGETALSTTNRNFTGRMGHRDSSIYLAGPQVAAATAVTGRISHPSVLD